MPGRPTSSAPVSETGGLGANPGLKQQLLKKALPATSDPWKLRQSRLVAAEAEAVAWLTAFPHLFLPVLLEEKLDTAKQYFAHPEIV